MNNQWVFVIIFILASINIPLCGGAICSCKCCTGNFCTPMLQGTITLSSCTTSSCKSACETQYPMQCTNGAGSTSYQCTDGSTSQPNWIGVFQVAGQCIKNACCCPVGLMTVSAVSNIYLRIQSQLAGQCPSSYTSLDQTVPVPSGFSSQMSFLTNDISVQLSQDSSRITITNSLYPSCSDMATRYNSVSTTASIAAVSTTARNTSVQSTTNNLALIVQLSSLLLLLLVCY